MHRRVWKRRSALALGLGLLVVLGVSGQVDPRPPEVRRFFVHFVDQRSLPEKVLNLFGFSNQEVGRSFALIAGVDTYDNLPGEDRRLEPAEVDMANLVVYLRDYEYFDEIVVLRNRDVTEENFRFLLQGYFPARLKQYPRSRFLFAYSGHGIQQGEQGFLLMSGARSMDDTSQGILMSALRQMYSVATEHAHHSLALINACHSGAFQGRPFGQGRLIPEKRGAHAISAGGTAERTWHLPEVGPGSVFFESMFFGLDGRADSYPPGQGDGLITVHELVAYLQPQVQWLTSKKQNPVPGDLDLKGSQGSFFFLDRGRQFRARTAAEWKSVRRSMGPEPSKELDPPSVEPPPKPSIVTGLQPEQEHALATASGWGASTAGAVQVNSLGMGFRYIPAGRFWMGSPETETEAGRENQEGPRHEVELSRGFWLGETEVTQGQWSSLVGKNPLLSHKVDQEGLNPSPFVRMGVVEKPKQTKGDSGLGPSLYRTDPDSQDPAET